MNDIIASKSLIEKDLDFTNSQVSWYSLKPFWERLTKINPIYIYAAFNTLLFLLYKIFGIVIPTFVPVSGLVLACLFSIAYDLKNKIIRDKDTLTTDKKVWFLNSGLKISLSFCRVVGVYFVFKGKIPTFNFLAFHNLLLATSIIFISANLIKLVTSNNKSLVNILLDALPIVIMTLGLVLFCDVFSVSSYLVGYDSLYKGSYFCFFALLGFYQVRDNKSMLGTFDLEKWPKYLLGFFIQAIFTLTICLDANVIAILSSIPASMYAIYLLFLTPLIFNQTLSEELIYRSVIIGIKDKLDAYNISYTALCIMFVFLFAYVHFGYFEQSFMGFMYCLSTFLPTSVAFILLCHFSEGVEYTSGIHFANNLVIIGLTPLSIINGGLAINSISWSTIGMKFLSTSLGGLLVLVPILIIERFFVLKNITDTSEKFKLVQDAKDSNFSTANSFHNKSVKLGSKHNIQYDGLDNIIDNGSNKTLQ